VTNSKHCPSCKSPIQKQDGCNHVKCAKCKHDFCWVCLESWKKHSSATGGYFRCNRYKESPGSGVLPPGDSSSSSSSLQASTLHRFVHFYTRYKNHDNSRRLEEPLLTSVHHKRALLQASLCGEQGGGRVGKTLDTQFYEDGVWELSKLRAILCGTYVYGYYLQDSEGRQVFERLQMEVEEVAEALAEVIARPYLRTPRKTIQQIVSSCRRKRMELDRAASHSFRPSPSDEELALRFTSGAVGGVPPHLDHNLTDVEKIYAIYDWLSYNENKDVATADPVGVQPACAGEREGHQDSGYVGAGSPDLDLAIAVEMSQLYNEKEITVKENCEKEPQIQDADLDLAIELSLKDQKHRQTRWVGGGVRKLGLM